MASIPEPKFEEWQPQFARKEFRAGRWPKISCSRVGMLYVKAGAIAIPSHYAEDFEKFCKMNSGPCPLLYRSRVGEVTAGPLAVDSDVRKDMQLYSIFVKGELQGTIGDVSHIPWDEMVSFYMGCSYSFEHALLKAGVPLRHIEQGTDVASYLTRVRTYPVGPFSGNMVVTMRAMPRDCVSKAVKVTAMMDQSGHGAPVHIGDSRIIGIRDVHKDLYNDVKANIKNGDVCVFWGCNATSGEAFRGARITKTCVAYSGENINSLFICDVRVDEYNDSNPPEFGETLRPEVTFISEEPLFVSLLSDRSRDKLAQLHACIGNTQSDTDFFTRASLRVSHADTIWVEISNILSTSLLDSVLEVVTFVKGATALGKQIRMGIPCGDNVMWRRVIHHCQMTGIISQPIVIDSGVSDEARAGELEMCLVVSFIDEGLNVGELKLGSFPGKTSTDHGTLVNSGGVLALALFVLHSCPIHSRYYRKGRGIFQQPCLGNFILTHSQVKEVRQIVYRDSPQDGACDMRFMQQLHQLVSVFE
ncbi:D-glutamate cyclase, mitochondrial [Nematostella vectensis]|uniref:D-glutamate cyclase, mitochondrial n=1 Tax=Nematostella vectensis TaxID=45351 RepID=UPI002076FC69|nr:D-glutamate cyclase, mitochondrial [Nematostella vectensis]